MKSAEKALAGAAGGVGGTLVLSALRSALREVGLVYETAPMQVVERLVQEADLPADRPVAKGALSLAAHLAYGTTVGAALGALRDEADDAGTEAAVGMALGVLMWGVGWAGWLPIVGADRAPWNYHNPKVLLPIVDHAVYGAVWGVLFWALSRDSR